MSNRVVKNASWIIGCKIVQSVLALLVGMLTARYLGPSNYGLINYASSLVAFVVPIMYLGFNSIIVQEIINDPEGEGETLGTAILLCMVSSIFCILGVTIFSYIANYGETDTIIVTFLYSFVLVFQAIEIIQYWFQAKLNSKYTSIVMLITYSAVSTYKIWLLVTEKTIYWFAISNAFDACLIGILLFFIYHKLDGPKFRFSFKRAKHMWMRSKHFILSSLMITVFTQTDKIMLKLMVDETVTGHYAAASTCIFLTNFVFSALFDSMRPVILEGKQKESNSAYECKVVMLYSTIVFLSLAQCLGIFLFAKWIILVLYGQAFSGAIGILRVIVWYTLFSYIGMSRSIWILAENQQRYLWVINLSGAISNIILNLILIPTMGGIGAALASLITQFVTNIIMPQIIPALRRSNYLLMKGIHPKYFYESMRRIIKR